MNLPEYVRDYGARSKLANKLGISKTTICQWVSGQREIPIKQCVKIEFVTDGAVTRIETRPDDWKEIWPELKNPSTP